MEDSSSPFFLERLAALLAHRSQQAASLGAGVPHRPHKPAARRVAYCSRSLSRRATWHGSHTVPPSTGGWVPQRVHVRASCRARSRRLPLSRANARHRSASLPPYRIPAALAFAHLARSALRRFSPQCRHKVRSGAGLAFPHLGHMPAGNPVGGNAFIPPPPACALFLGISVWHVPPFRGCSPGEGRPADLWLAGYPRGRPFSAPCACAPRTGPSPPIPNTGCRNRRSSRRCTR